ncbi:MULTISPECIES: GNAT family N-acetyltransferase [Paenibacillus]|uniref:N-acetyltransferase n=1 Tax=Paenibacillus albilobatus TaxID=2716884 RepID=A0A920CCD1_9BACL|nr:MULTISPECIES: GNAT family N-acetyltransferase [Paenibacillus]MDR9854279.1 GNAT family N-acetyltransferase [Paenibacillus sp. VCA1]GIO34571.1 N-acetyltransferase [Paenibacillus albilobatus]
MREIREADHGYVMVEDGREVAEITFQPIDERTVMIDHTFVSEELRGQRVGDQLVKAVVDWARKEGKRIVPACSFALVQFKRHKDYKDVWHQEEKA